MTDFDRQTYHFFDPSEDAIGDGGTHSVQRVGNTHTFGDTLEKHPLRLRPLFDIEKCSPSRPVPMMLNEKVKKCDIYLMSQFAGLLVSQDAQEGLGSVINNSFSEPIAVELDHERLKRGFPTSDYKYLGMKLQNAIATSFVNWGETRFGLLNAIYARRSPDRSLPFEETELTFCDFDQYSQKFAPMAGLKDFFPTKLSFVGMERQEIFHWNGAFYIMSDECKSVIEDDELTGLRFSGRSVEVTFS